MTLDPEVRGALERACAVGDVGEKDLDRAIEHAYGFVPEGFVDPSAHVVDLGSGGGLPAFPLIERLPATRWSLVESRTGRAERLAVAVERLGWAERVTVVRARAEEVGHGPLRGTADLVLARSFGRPAVVAECGAPLLANDGRIVVSEPPSTDGRWPADGLARVGLVAGEVLRGLVGRYQVLELAGVVPRELPRRPGVAKRRPLF